MVQIPHFILSAWQTLRAFLRLCRRRLKTTITLLVVLLIAWASYAVTRPAAPEYVTAAAVRGDLRQTVEAVGTVTSERALELQFPALDVVTQVLVREGDEVKAGQRLAALRSATLAAGVASAQANVLSAQASLRALEEGSRPEDIAIKQAQVDNKRASLEAVKQTLVNAEANLIEAERQLTVLRSEASIALSGQVSTAGSTASQQLAIAKTALLSTSGVFDASDVQDAVIKSGSWDYQSLRTSLNASLAAVTEAQGRSSPTEYQSALSVLSAARAAVSQATDTLTRSYDILSLLPITSVFTVTSRETNKATIATQKSYAQASLAALDTALKSLQDASAGYDSKIALQQSEIISLRGTRDRAKADISTYQTSLQIDEASLALALAPARQTDIDAAKARVRQAQADLSRASAQFSDTILRAPVDGVITKVAIKVGEMRPSAEPSISMLGTSPFRVEMFVSEVDIPKVQVSQTGAITLDAFRDASFPLRVSEIDSAASDVEGVPKYRVRLDFTSTMEGLRVGMTGDAEIETGRKEDVVSVPGRAIVDRDGESVVRILRGTSVEERPVTVGMEGEGGAVEVTGIDEGEIVIVLEKK